MTIIWEGSMKKIDYKTIMEIFLTIVSIILMKVNGGYIGVMLLMILVIYDIIEIIKNFLKHKRKI